jgi:Domain of unknown function (DUF4124)
MIKTGLIAAALLLAAQPLLAQNKKVYRCENAAGRVTYSDEACKGGAELKNDDARNSEQRQAAADVARREERLATRMTKERRAAEKAAPKPGAGVIAHSAARGADGSAKAKPKEGKRAKKKSRDGEKTQG